MQMLCHENVKIKGFVSGGLKLKDCIIVACDGGYRRIKQSEGNGNNTGIDTKRPSVKNTGKELKKKRLIKEGKQISCFFRIYGRE